MDSEYRFLGAFRTPARFAGLTERPKLVPGRSA